jgi:transglutaminase-like putative cysteine protease
LAEKVRIMMATVILALLFTALILPRIYAHDLPSNDPSDYIRPYEPEVVELAKKTGSMEAAYYWVSWNIRYMSDRDRWGVPDYWQLPSTTIRLGTGDCEDQAILLTSLIRALGVSRENVHLVYGRMELIRGGLIGYHAWVEVKIPEETAQTFKGMAMQILESLLQENKTFMMVIFLEDRPLYLNVSREAIMGLQTLGWGDRDGWIPLDPTTAFLYLPDGSKIPIPFSLWMWFGYYVYYLVPVKVIPEYFYVDKLWNETTVTRTIYNNVRIVGYSAPSAASPGQTISIQLTVEYSLSSTSYVGVTISRWLSGGSWEKVWENPDSMTQRSGQGTLTYSAAFMVPNQPGTYEYAITAWYWDGSRWVSTDEKHFTIEVSSPRTVTTTIAPYTVEVRASDVRLSVGEVGSSAVILKEAPKGLAGYEIIVGLAYFSQAQAGAPQDVAEIVDISFPEWAGLREKFISPDGKFARIKAVDVEDRIRAGDEEIVLAEVVLKAKAEGRMLIYLNISRMDDDEGEGMLTATKPGVLEVSGGPPPVEPNLPPPRDLDGDGLYEDVNGNGRLDFDDVVKFFKHFDDPVISQYPGFYDFNRNGRLDYDDIVELFRRV